MAAVKKARTSKKTPESKSNPSKQVSSVGALATSSVDLQDAIRERAYELYQQRGGRDGSDMEDWIRAEREVLERLRLRTA